MHSNARKATLNHVDEGAPTKSIVMGPVTASQPGLEGTRTIPLWREWRALVLACAAGSSVVNPNFALRESALLCGIILLSLMKRSIREAADVCAVLLTLWTAVSLLWAVDLSVTERALANQLAVLAIFLSVRSAVTNSKQLAIVVVGFLGGCLYAISQLIIQNQQAITVGLSVKRFGIEGVNLNYMAYSLTTGLALVVLLWRILRPGPTRLALISTVPILCFGVAKNGTRGAMIGAVVLLLWIIAQKASRRIGLVVPLAGLSIAAVSIFTGLSDGPLRLLVRAAGRSTGDIAGRLTTWSQARESILSHPFIGIGAGGFRTVNPYDIGAHNVPLEAASGLGLIGLALLIAVAYSALLTGTQNLEPVSRRLLVGGIVVASGPIVLSGHWEYSPAAWLSLAIFSRIVVLLPSDVQQQPPAKVGGNFHQRIQAQFTTAPK